MAETKFTPGDWKKLEKLMDVHAALRAALHKPAKRKAKALGERATTNED